MPTHIVRTGQCITSIADSAGFYWKTVWEHADNKALVELRGDPNMVVSGDEVFVPDKIDKEESCATEDSYKFKKKGIPAVIRIQMFDGQEPRANQNFRVVLGPKSHKGTSDAEGIVEFPVDSGLTRAHLTIGEDEREYALNIGQLPPIAELTGVQVRLKNLGFLTGRVSGELDESTKSALTAFQTDMELEVTGEPDDETCDALEAAHDDSNSF